MNFLRRKFSSFWKETIRCTKASLGWFFFIFVKGSSTKWLKNDECIQYTFNCFIIMSYQISLWNMVPNEHSWHKCTWCVSRKLKHLKRVCKWCNVKTVEESESQSRFALLLFSLFICRRSFYLIRLAVALSMCSNLKRNKRISRNKKVFPLSCVQCSCHCIHAYAHCMNKWWLCERNHSDCSWELEKKCCR